MKNTTIDMYLGKWEDKNTTKTYHVYLDSGAPIVSSEDRTGRASIKEFTITHTDKQPDRIELEQLACDVWEITNDHIVFANAARVVVKLTRIV